MLDNEQSSHIRNLYLIEYNKINKSKRKQEITSKKEKLKLAFYYSLISIMVSVVSQYVIDIVFKLINKTPFKELFKVSFPWQIYYSVIISSAFIGLLKVYLPAKIISVVAVLISTIIYQTLAKITNQDVLTNEELIESIIADIFIIELILYIYGKLSNKNNKENEDQIENLLVITLSTSLIINISAFLSKNIYSILFNFNTSNDEEINEL